MVASEDIARLNARIDELKDYLTRIEERIDATHIDMGNVRENMATRGDIDRIRVAMATSKDVERLWKLNWVYLGTTLALLVALVGYFLTKK